MLRIPYEQLPLSDDFSIVPSDYYKANGGVVFPNPNAPTGKLMPLDEIEDIIEHNQDVIVVVDEAYVDFGGESALPLIDKYLIKRHELSCRSIRVWKYYSAVCLIVI